MESKKLITKKLETKLEFTFEEHDEPVEFNVDMKVETHTKSKDIKIIKAKRKVQDPSTKLF